MAGKIFINYRRDDARDMSARVRDRLAATFGNGNVFMDVDNLMAGQRFDRELEKALAETDIFLAVIGSRWMELFAARQASRERDYVHEEIAGALKRGIVVIPVLIERAPLPRGDALPEDIRELVLHQKHSVAHEQFGRDVAGLVEAIRFARRSARKSGGGQMIPSIPWGWIGATAVGILALAWVGAYQLGMPVWWPWATTPQSAALQPTKQDLDTAARKRVLADEAKRKADAEIKRQADQKAQAAAETKRRADEEAAQRDPALGVTPGSGQSFRDRLANGQPCPMCPEMVVAPSGTFTMGSPANEPQRQDQEARVHVSIGRPFAVGKFAVTFDEWDACVADGGCNGYRPADQGWGRGKRPVINVSWEDATAYAIWLSLKTSKTYRLPSEAEREYVTRAGTTTPFWWGTSITPKQANYNGSYAAYQGGGLKGEHRGRTVPVDSFAVNPWGLYQVHGNVWEWTEDCWNDSNQGNPGNGSARTVGDCSRRVLRGGSWNYLPLGLRAAYRFGDTADDRVDFDGLGFRLVRTLNP